MKLSNKLLIAFAASLILIPVFGMVFISATKYKTGSYTDVVHKIENFDTPTKNMESIAVSTAFETVNIVDAKGKVLNVQFIKDAKFGVKIPAAYKDLITLSVGANGELQIIIKDEPKSDKSRRENYYTNIYVYAPSFKGLKVLNASDVNIMAVADSITVDVKKSGSVSLETDAKIQYLMLKTVDVTNVYFRDDILKSVDLDLNNTKITATSCSFENLSILTAGKCEVELEGTYDKTKKYTINNLILNTTGIADFKLENVTVKNCSGKLSDQTQVYMPAVNLNQMYNKK
jgi:hypothetical protein